jgi:hypothetical protein
MSPKLPPALNVSATSHAPGPNRTAGNPESRAREKNDIVERLIFLADDDNAPHLLVLLREVRLHPAHVSENLTEHGIRAPAFLELDNAPVLLVVAGEEVDPPDRRLELSRP